MDTNASATQAGFSVAEWVRAAGISRSGFYILPPELRPATVRIGKRIIVREAPDAWLRRVAEQQGAITKAA